MITGNGKLTNQTVTPVSKDIQIMSYVNDQGELISHTIAFKDIQYFLVNDGKRITTIQDAPENWKTRSFALTSDNILPADAQQLNDILIRIFDTAIQNNT